MRDSARPQQLKQARRRIGLYRIERFARKLLGKEAGGAHCGVRAKKGDRFVRLKRADYGLCVRKLEQIKGPPIVY